MLTTFICIFLDLVVVGFSVFGVVLLAANEKEKPRHICFQSISQTSSATRKPVQLVLVLDPGEAPTQPKARIKRKANTNHKHTQALARNTIT